MTGRPSRAINNPPAFRGGHKKIWENSIKFSGFKGSGIDGGKNKRHIVVDTMGNLLAVMVHAVNIHDTKSGILAAADS